MLCLTIFYIFELVKKIAANINRNTIGHLPALLLRAEKLKFVQNVFQPATHSVFSDKSLFNQQSLN